MQHKVVGRLPPHSLAMALARIPEPPCGLWAQSPPSCFVKALHGPAGCRRGLLRTQKLFGSATCASLAADSSSILQTRRRVVKVVRAYGSKSYHIEVWSAL